MKPIPWPLVLVPSCTGLLDLIEERKVQTLQTLPKWGEGFPEKEKLCKKRPKTAFPIGSILVFVSDPIKGMNKKEISIHPSSYLVISTVICSIIQEVKHIISNCSSILFETLLCTRHWAQHLTPSAPLVLTTILWLLKQVN